MSDPWDHFYPEYYISVDGYDISASEINIIDKSYYSTLGNSQWGALASNELDE